MLLYNHYIYIISYIFTDLDVGVFILGIIFQCVCVRSSKPDHDGARRRNLILARWIITITIILNLFLVGH